MYEDDTIFLPGADTPGNVFSTAEICQTQRRNIRHIRPAPFPLRYRTATDSNRRRSEQLCTVLFDNRILQQCPPEYHNTPLRHRSQLPDIQHSRCLHQTSYIRLRKVTILCITFSHI